jgi:hypothetical protein
MRSRFRLPQAHEPGRAHRARSVAGTPCAAAASAQPQPRLPPTARYLRSPIDYRVIFSKVGGRWQIMMLFAGD